MKPKSRFFKRNRGLFIYFSALLLVLALLRIIVFETYLVTYNSMNNTLMDTDKILINKIKKVARNSIVVFQTERDTYVKRCAGLPGDTIAIKAGRVFINGSESSFPPTAIPFPEGEQRKSQSAGERFDIMSYEYYGQYWNRHEFGPLIIPRKGMVIAITAESCKIYRRLILKEQKIDVALYDKYIAGLKSYEFKNDYYFMLGDNRPVSTDSRTNLGLITKDQIIGVTCFVLYSQNDRSRLFKQVK